MSMHGIVESPESVDYRTKCCCLTTDGVYYQAPKEYFCLHPTIKRRRLHASEPFNVPLEAARFEKLLETLEKASVTSVALATADADSSGSHKSQRLPWMNSLTKRQEKFVDGCLGIKTWEGQDVCFYEEKLPKENDVVWVSVKQVNDTSATVELLEYGNHEGIIPYTEVTRIRIRAIGRVIKVGKNEAAQVIRIDKDKGYIDLSKKQVTPKEAKECEDRYSKGNDVRSIVCYVAKECGMSAEEAMKMIAYPLYRRQPGKHAYTWLQELHKTRNVEEILGPLNLPEKAKEVLLNTVDHKMKTGTFLIHADIEMTCFQCDGVNAIREVLLMGQHFKEDQQPQIPISVTIIGPPKYCLRAKTEQKDEGIQRMKEVIEAMNIEMSKRGGVMKVTSGPYVLGDEENVKERKNDDDYDDDDNSDEDGLE